MFILQNESKTYNEDLQRVINGKYPYAFIVHDKDKHTNVHTHVCIYVVNGCSLDNISKEYQHKKENIEIWDTKRHMLEYIIHKNELEKYHYNVSEVFGTLKNDLLKYLSSQSEEESNKILIDFIYSNDKYITLMELVRFALDNNIWSYFRRSSLIYIELIKEHNKFISSYNI